jgi:hypothetical protein
MTTAIAAAPAQKERRLGHVNLATGTALQVFAGTAYAKSLNA